MSPVRFLSAVSQVQQGLGDFASTNQQLHDLYSQALTWQVKYNDEGNTWYSNYGYKVRANSALVERFLSRERRKGAMVIIGNTWDMARPPLVEVPPPREDLWAWEALGVSPNGQSGALGGTGRDLALLRA